MGTTSWIAIIELDVASASRFSKSRKTLAKERSPSIRARLATELQTEESFMAPVRYRAADVDGFKIFYREAGPADAPKLLLLHGFPSAGHMFRDLIPLLANRFHMVAPDF